MSRHVDHAEKAGAPLVGNAIAYFVVVLWLVNKGIIPEDQQTEAVAMGGAIITWAGLQGRTIFGFVANLIRSRFGKPG